MGGCGSEDQKNSDGCSPSTPLDASILKGRRKMIIEQNVPTSIRNWAYCLVETRRYEAVISRLRTGNHFSLGTYGIYKCLVGRHGRAGKKKFMDEYCKPEIARLKHRCAWYCAIAERIRLKSETAPENWLLSKDEMLSMVGSVLHFSRNGKDVYDAIQGCSEDGNCLYTNSSRVLDPMSLLSLGFGKNVQQTT